MADKHMKYLSLLETIAGTVLPVRSSKHAACIVYKNTIISIGTNRIKSHPFQRRFARNPESIFIHAEVEAIAKALKKISLNQLEKSTLYVLRIKKDNSFGKFIWGNSKPCTGCASCISEFGIENIVYSNPSHNVSDKNYESF
jgi:deoxycytidylate deaminase